MAFVAATLITTTRPGFDPPRSALGQSAYPTTGSPSELEAAISITYNEGNFMAYESAAKAYLELLRESGKAWTGDDKAVVRRQLQFLSLIIPKSAAARLELERLLSGRADSTSGSALVHWWRQQDPLPATLNNERIEEHLFRTYFAQRNYGSKGDSMGVDDRGRIFVRLGTPWRSTQIKLRSAGLRMQPFQVTVPRNEIWVYRQVHDDAHYLFVQRSRRRPYTLATSRDLIPPDLRMSRRRIPLLLSWLEEVFAQLALEHSHYGTTYDAVTNYLTLPTSDALQPYNFSRRILEEMRIRDDYHEQSRERTVPASATQVYGRAASLTPVVRAARFLQPNGATRLEVYWTLDARELEPRRRLANILEREGHTPSETYLLAVTAAQRDANYVPTEIRMRKYSVPVGTRGLLPVHTWVSQEFDVELKLALQWEQSWTVVDSTGLRIPGATLGIGTLSLDSMQALDATGNTLELSDIRPMLIPKNGDLNNALPYAADTISTSSRLALYFELYHLSFGDDDKTHYTIEYRISAPGEIPIAANTVYEGTTRVVREQLALDVSGWSKPGPIAITLEAMDNVTGEVVSRTTPFTLRR